uniref:ubiquitinyl hydrolase 1 n=2 Tax=Lygus hesperus TaxID=30085 RepID=A0A146KSA9_LYGHE
MNQIVSKYANMAMDKDNVLLLGLTACALGLSFFILWGPKIGRRTFNNCSLVALQNLGLTCFLNSLLQALASCPSFIEWLTSRKKNGKVSESLFDVLKLLCYEREPGGAEDVYSPAVLVQHLRGKAWPTFPQEQDPHELFLHILTALEEEELRSTPERAESLLDALGSKEEDDLLVANRVSGHGDVPIVKRVINSKIEKPVLTPSPFRGYLASQLSCLNCGSRSAVVYDKFDTLTLALPSKGICFKLQRLLGDFVSAELVDGFSCDHCNEGRDPSEPPVLSQASKAIKIGKLPKCLSLHISRTYMSNEGFMYKRDNYVDFPEYLMMSHYTHNSSMLKDKKPLKKLSPDAPPIKFPKGSLSGSAIDGTDSDPTLTKYKTLGTPDDSDATGLSSEEEFASLSPKTDAVPENIMKNNNNTVPTHVFAAGASFISGPVYRLKAVVEHRGTIDSGHFVTYRRGPLQSQIRHRSSDLLDQSESRWFFTSDEIVKKSTLCEALQANAYLLFYEKCVNDVLPVPNSL